MGTLSAVLIVLNEESRIEACLKALGWADEIVVVDSGSKDRTVELARRYAGKVLSRPFDNFSGQKNFAIAQASGDWILSVDADELVTDSLREEIKSVLSGPEDRSGFYLQRSNVIFGKELRFGGQGREPLLRLFRRGRGRFEQPIHEKLVVEGRTGVLRGTLLHYSTATLAEYLRKLAVYTDHEARWAAERGLRPSWINLALKPPARFFINYILKCGFLDGYPGLLYHTLSCYYDILKEVKLRELCVYDKQL